MLTLRAPINLVTTNTECWKCKASTPVSSLRVHEIIEDEEPPIEDVRIVDAEALPDVIAQAVQTVNPNYRRGFSRSAGINYWANHCAHCGSLQGDFFLNSEPDGPFFGGQKPEGSVTKTLFESGQWPADAGYCF